MPPLVGLSADAGTADTTPSNRETLATTLAGPAATNKSPGTISVASVLNQPLTERCLLGSDNHAEVARRSRTMWERVPFRTISRSWPRRSTVPADASGYTPPCTPRMFSCPAERGKRDQQGVRQLVLPRQSVPI